MKIDKSIQDSAVKVVIGIGVAYIFGVPILRKLGLLPDPNKQLVDKTVVTPGNAFDPNLWMKTGIAPIMPEPTNDLAKNLYDSFSWTSDDFNEVFSTFKKLSNKRQVSYLAYVFAKNYKQDLLQYMKDGPGGGIFIWDGLNPEHMAQLITWVNAMPA